MAAIIHDFTSSMISSRPILHECVVPQLSMPVPVQAEPEAASKAELEAMLSKRMRTAERARSVVPALRGEVAALKLQLQAAVDGAGAQRDAALAEAQVC